MPTSQYCPRCGSGRLARLPKNDLSPFRGYRCEACGRRLRDRGSLVLYLPVMAVGLFFASTMIMVLFEPKDAANLGKAAGLGVVSLICVGWTAAEMSRPTPRRRAPAGDWHVARDGRKVGPFAIDQMRQLAASGALSAADMVLDPRSGTWASAGTVAGLFPAVPRTAAGAGGPHGD